jgi:hypothetical protein
MLSLIFAVSALIPVPYEPSWDCRGNVLLRGIVHLEIKSNHDLTWNGQEINPETFDRWISQNKAMRRDERFIFEVFRDEKSTNKANEIILSLKKSYSLFAKNCVGIP